MVQFLDNPRAGLVEIPRQADTPVGQHPLGQAALAYWAAYYGDPDLALDYLSRSAKGNADSTLLWRPMLRDVRKLPGFKDLVRNLGLVEYWRAYGWPAPHLCRPTTGDDYTCG